MKKVVVIIPVRMGSKRFPGKPLTRIKGQTLLQRCYESAKRSTLADAIFITTPDEEIRLEVASWGDFPINQVIMTKLTCRNGTERVAVAADLLRLPLDTVVVNCQGDQFWEDDEGRMIDNPVLPVLTGKKRLATVVSPVMPGELENPDVVKAILSGDGMVTTYTRQVPVGYCDPIFKHVGIYVGLKMDYDRYLMTPQHPKEREEGLEQFRWWSPMFGCLLAYPLQVFDRREVVNG